MQRARPDSKGKVPDGFQAIDYRFTSGSPPPRNCKTAANRNLFKVVFMSSPDAGSMTGLEKLKEDDMSDGGPYLGGVTPKLILSVSLAFALVAGACVYGLEKASERATATQSQEHSHGAGGAPIQQYGMQP